MKVFFPNKMIRTVQMIAILLAVGTQVLSAGSDQEAINLAQQKAVAWLKTQQQTNGAWAPVEKSAITAMVIVGCSKVHLKAEQMDFLEKGRQFLLSNLQPDGGIYSGTNHQNYNTSWSIMALAALNHPEDRPIIQKARELIVSWQTDLNEKGKIDSQFDGGIGYGDGTPRANLANTLAPLEALHKTRSFAGKNEPSLNRPALLDFLHHCQNYRVVNHESWVADDPENAGGFIYHPQKSFAGEIKLPNGETGYRTYGSMSYAGLLCCVYAGLDKKSPEVRGDLDWIEKHFSLEENPGMGQQGLFYYYHLLAKALTSAGIQNVKTQGGEQINWSKELQTKLLSVQKTEGYWLNANDRWMEDNPVLCTAYALMALDGKGAVR